MPTPHSSLGFIGAGNMAEAIVRGVLRVALYQPAQITAGDPSPDRRQLFCNELQIRCSADTLEVAAHSDIVVLAVKPQMMATALDQIKPALNPKALVVSIAAAISTKFIESHLAPNTRVIRVMPNTPMLVGAGMSALAQGKNATEEDLALVERIFSAGGKTVRVTEDLIDAVTALSGSGPAYVFYLVETMTDAGIKIGLNPADAALLARQTLIGAAHLLDQSKDSPAELRRKVTSPGGTTQAAIESMQANNLANLITLALTAAKNRSLELSK